MSPATTQRLAVALSSQFDHRGLGLTGPFVPEWCDTWGLTAAAVAADSGWAITTVAQTGGFTKMAVTIEMSPGTWYKAAFALADIYGLLAVADGHTVCVVSVHTQLSVY